MPSIYPALKAPTLIRNDSLTSEESKANKLFVNILHVEYVMSILKSVSKLLSPRL